MKFLLLIYGLDAANAQTGSLKTHKSCRNVLYFGIWEVLTGIVILQLFQPLLISTIAQSCPIAQMLGTSTTNMNVVPHLALSISSSLLKSISRLVRTSVICKIVCNLSITTWSIGMHGSRGCPLQFVYENFLNVTCKISFKWYICED